MHDRKLKLEVDDLAVETFRVAEDVVEKGTVFARNSVFPGMCGFTYDPVNLACFSYAVECPPSRVPTNCTDSEPTAYVCDSCRDSVTACE